MAVLLCQYTEAFVYLLEAARSPAYGGSEDWEGAYACRLFSALRTLAHSKHARDSAAERLSFDMISYHIIQV